MGRTDVALCPEGRQELLEKKLYYPVPELLVISPMLRCRESMELIYGERKLPVIVAEQFKECDFGTWECKTFQELDGDPYYQAWIDSGALLPFPEGECQESFEARCVEGFLSVLHQIRSMEKIPECVGFVVHGGTIMSFMHAFNIEEKGYFDFQCKPGQGYICECLFSDEPNLKKENVQFTCIRPLV